MLDGLKAFDGSKAIGGFLEDFELALEEFERSERTKRNMLCNKLTGDAKEWLYT